MNERAVELYKQAVTFAYNTAGQDAGNGTVIESLTAGKFAELIVQECNEVLRLVPYNSNVEFGDEVIYQDAIKQHFGIEE